MQPLLLLCRDRWDDPGNHPQIDRRLAFVVGGISHQACDTVVKPLLSRHAGSEWNLAHDVLQRQPKARGREHEVDTDHVQEVSAYYDVHVFRKVYLEGREEPFNRLMLASGRSDPAQALEDFIGSSFQRALLSCHTLVPPSGSDQETLAQWQDKLFAYMQTLYIQPRWWIQAFNEPDPAKQERFEVETKFYAANDPAIRAARALQQGRKVDGSDIAAATAEGANQSIYGQALELSSRYLRAATAFWHREAEELVAPNAYIPAWQLERA
ncbi:MAG: hypothetical protein ABWY78_02680 [Microvirga sp.]